MTRPALARIERDIGSVDFATIVRPGDRVVVGQGAAEPLTLTQQLVAQKERIGPFEIFLGPLYSDTFAAEKTEGIRFSSYGAIWRTARVNIDYHIEAGRHYYSVPCQLAGQQGRRAAVGGRRFTAWPETAMTVT